MKSGVIVYVIGEEPAGWDADSEQTSVRRRTKADRVEIITRNTGHFDVLDAWWSLLTRGMKRITCVIGEFTPSGRLMLTGRELGLCE